MMVLVMIGSPLGMSLMTRCSRLRAGTWLRFAPIRHRRSGFSAYLLIGSRSSTSRRSSSSVIARRAALRRVRVAPDWGPTRRSPFLFGGFMRDQGFWHFPRHLGSIARRSWYACRVVFYRDLLPHFHTSLWHTAHANALDSLRLKPRALVASIGPVAGLGHSPVGGRVGPWL